MTPALPFDPEERTLPIVLVMSDMGRKATSPTRLNRRRRLLRV